MKTITLRFLILFLLISTQNLSAQQFYFGADQSYVNEMEDCGVQYAESGEVKDVYDIYESHGNNLVRLRLWHTPSWYDNLNSGNRYSDLDDIKKSIRRAKDHNMAVLLDFHLSDNWADPSKQLVPAAWLDVVNNLDVLEDSLYNYIYATLETLHTENLLPEMVQIGNETNRGILLSPEDNQVWTLDWERNAALFNSGINAVRDFSEASDKEVKIALHIAAPDNAGWLAEQFHDNGVTDFDIIALSYYWAWHKPTTIEETGAVIEALLNKYDKEVMIVETGYIWTTNSNDNANNIISEVHPDYSPASPENQRDWLIDLTKEVIASGGIGVCYWEPSWVSTDCFNQWDQGSHQEHATFFDFSNDLLIPGGIQWMEYDYGLTSIEEAPFDPEKIQMILNQDNQLLNISIADFNTDFRHDYQVIDTTGKIIKSGVINYGEKDVKLKKIGTQLVFVQIYVDRKLVKSEKFVLVD